MLGSEKQSSGFGGNGGGFGALGSPSSRLYKKPLPTPPLIKPPVAQPNGPVPPWLMQSQVPAATLGGPIPGLQDYMMNLPQYGYFGLPGQQRPQSAMLGGQPQPPLPTGQHATGNWRAAMLGGF